MNRLRSVLEIPPIGLMSALEQSYLVMYPRRLWKKRYIRKGINIKNVTFFKCYQWNENIKVIKFL